MHKTTFQFSRMTWTVRFLCLCAILLNAKHVKGSYEIPKERILTEKDLGSYPNYLTEEWKFFDGDDDSLRLPEFSEKGMFHVNPEMDIYTQNPVNFKGIGWFRLHLKFDKEIDGQLFALAMTHYGASEIYLDGKLIKKFGEINGPDSSLYIDPQEIPFAFCMADSLEHVLAIRYANYNAVRNFETYNQEFRGFRIMIGSVNSMIDMKHMRSVFFAITLMVICGIFFALSMIHLFMFLYYRSVKTNVYFSLFTLSLAALFALLFVVYSAEDPVLEIRCLFSLNPILVIACVSLAGFTKEFTRGNKWWFRIFLFFGIFIIALRFIEDDLFLFLTMFLTIAVSLYAVIMTIIAIFRRIPGARIIGAGLLFFALFVITILSFALVNNGEFELTESSFLGQVFTVFLGLSVISIPLSMSVYLAWNFASINKNLNNQLVQVQILSQKTIEQEQEKQRMLENRKEELEKEVQERTSELRAEKQKSDDLLKNILPDAVAEELKEKGGADAKLIDQVTVLFSDFKGFTAMSENRTPGELIQDIHECFSAFDKIMEKNGLEKIKTIGDAYMAAGGIPSPNTTHAHDAARAALEMSAFIENYKKEKTALGLPFFEIRIGLNTGPVVAGIVGIKKFAYDIWGDTVNTASRMESSGEVGKVNISETTWQLIRDQFQCTHRGKIFAKGKGEIDMYFLDGPK